MLSIKQKLTASELNPDTTLQLPFEKRQKSRLKVILDDGRDAGLFLPRGDVLRDGDFLQAEDETIVQIKAADETVSQVYCDDPLLLARACYHLGNRHVPLQIESHYLRYLHDHVLDDMLKGFGLTATIHQAPFEPESGAYGGHAHSHSHDHGHQHGRTHEHSHKNSIGNHTHA